MSPAGVLRAQHVWLGPGRVLSPGEVTIDARGRIAAVRRARGGRVAPWFLVPGLVDAHVHLQIGALAGPRPRTFVEWLAAVIAARRGANAVQDAVARTEASIAELLDSGCTAVGEIDSLGTSPAVLRRAGLAGRCYQEVLGYDVFGRAARALVAARAARGTRACASGLSPHAPYSCSFDVLVAARRSARFLTVHVAEAREEIELLASGRGPLRALLARLGRWPAGHRPVWRSPVEWLRRAGALGPRTLLVHMQEATAADLDLVRAARAPIVVCPPTIRWFERTPPDVPAWRAAGIRVALGTDSRASSPGPLSMTAAMAEARRLWPGLSPEHVLAMATSDAARAIGRPGLGRIAPGARADLCAYRLPRALASGSALDAATAGALPVHAVWLAGRRRLAGRVRRAMRA